jgi:hypothetical protein
MDILLRRTVKMNEEQFKEYQKHFEEFNQPRSTHAWTKEVLNLNTSSEVTKVLLHTGWWHHCMLDDGFEMLDLLSTCSIDESVFYTNGKNNMFDLIDPRLSSNLSFQSIFEDLNDICGKGVGKGEHLMSLLVTNWKKDSSCDGLLNDHKIEVKSLITGCSLKPIKTGLTVKGLVDTLNKKYYDAADVPPKMLFERIMNGTRATMCDYFSELYPGKDVEDMVESLYPMTDYESFGDKIATTHLKWYKKNDDWESIIFIHPKSASLIVLNDLSEVDSLRPYILKSSIKLKRGADTQAVSDGYSVISYDGKRT